MKPVRPADWVYLVVSFALSMWLIEAQRSDMPLSDAKATAYLAIARWCRRVRIAAMEMERHAIDLCNQELERRL